MRKFLKILSAIICGLLCWMLHYYFSNPVFPILFFIIHLLISIAIYSFLEYIIDWKIKS